MCQKITTFNNAPIIFTSVEPTWTASFTPLIIKAFTDATGTTFNIDAIPKPGNVVTCSQMTWLRQLKTNQYAPKHIDPAKYEKWD